MKQEMNSIVETLDKATIASIVMISVIVSLKARARYFGSTHRAKGSSQHNK